VDPGKNLFLGGVIVNNNGISNFKFSNKTYHHEIGFFSRKMKLKKFTGKLDESIEQKRKNLPHICERHAIFNYKEFVKFRLENMKEKMEAYLEKKIARLNFDGYIRKNKVLGQTVEKLVPSKGKISAIFLGDTHQYENSPMKGYNKLPNNDLVKKLKNHPRCNIFSVNEFRTTKLCSSCYNVLQPPIKPRNGRKKELQNRRWWRDRYRTCKICKMVWNRDVNAGDNIFKLGHEQYIEKLERNPLFVNGPNRV
jgi:hypothetical protein